MIWFWPFCISLKRQQDDSQDKMIQKGFVTVRLYFSYPCLSLVIWKSACWRLPPADNPRWSSSGHYKLLKGLLLDLDASSHVEMIHVAYRTEVTLRGWVGMEVNICFFFWTLVLSVQRDSGDLKGGKEWSVVLKNWVCHPWLSQFPAFHSSFLVVLKISYIHYQVSVPVLYLFVSFTFFQYTE